MGEGRLLDLESKFKDLFTYPPQHLGVQLFVLPVVSMGWGVALGKRCLCQQLEHVKAWLPRVLSSCFSNSLKGS